MIRNETADSWILVKHPDHAWLAGQLADAWGNERFARPDPFNSVRYAVYHHDDAWAPRDAAPSLTPQGKPEAFTSALVGAYSAFEEIDLPNYLKVRGDATSVVAAQDLYAGIVVSMHTYNLLSEQADLSTIRPEHRPIHAEFLAAQLSWQQESAAKIGARPADLQRAFEFLQCCDNLSLIVCSSYPAARDLRHTHPDRSGTRHAIRCTPVDAATYTLSPWPFAGDKLVLSLPFRAVAKSSATSLDAFRAAFDAAPVQSLLITLLAA